MVIILNEHPETKYLATRVRLIDEEGEPQANGKKMNLPYQHQSIADKGFSPKKQLYCPSFRHDQNMHYSGNTGMTNRQ